ncbi:MAG: peptidoglycan endopeptidase, partial [Flavobacterium sp.]
MKQALLLFMMMHLCIECHAQKYISQIPFKYDYSLDLLKKQSKMKEVSLKNQSVVNDNSENLSDDVLALKEKYSIVLAVMPNKITNYQLYAYIDPWLNTPYKEKSF